MSQRKCSNTPNDKYQDQSKSWSMDLMDFYQSKQSIDFNKYDYPIGNLDKTFPNPEDKSKTYVWFGCG